MARPPITSRHLIGDRVATAKSTTDQVQEDIQEAEAKLQLATAVIADNPAESVTKAELAQAVSHNEQVEEKLREAGDRLLLVSDLLASEERDRQRLEQASGAVDGPGAPGSRTGEGSSSVIDHLRELTRHKLNTDHAR